VIHLIARAGFEVGQHPRVEPLAQRMRAKRAERHRDAREEGAKEKEVPFHVASGKWQVAGLRPSHTNTSLLTGGGYQSSDDFVAEGITVFEHLGSEHKLTPVIPAARLAR